VETPYVHSEVQTEFSCVKYRLNVIFKFLFSLVSIIPPFLHTLMQFLPEGQGGEAWEPTNGAAFFQLLRSIGQKCTFIFQTPK
jgi:hypothetical protein